MTATTEFPDYRILTVERQLTAVIPASVRVDKMPETQRSLRFKLAAVVPALGAGPVGPTFTLWRPPVNGVFDMEPGVIVSRSFAPKGDVVASALPAGRAVHFRLVSPYDGLPRAWAALLAWCAAQKLKLAGANWEIYRDGDDDVLQPETSLYALLA
ncbi:MAG: GyrI-like domain-containing protein [Rhodoplanes sp.]